MPMKKYSTFAGTSEVELHQQRLISFIQRISIFWWVWILHSADNSFEILWVHRQLFLYQYLEGISHKPVAWLLKSNSDSLFNWYYWSLESVLIWKQLHIHEKVLSIVTSGSIKLQGVSLVILTLLSSPATRIAFFFK